MQRKAATWTDTGNASVSVCVFLCLSAVVKSCCMKTVTLHRIQAEMIVCFFRCCC